MLRAYEAAVIELSVGAGLATVLLVIAFAMTGDEIQPLRPLVPRRLSYTLILAAVLLLLLLLPPHIESEAPASDAPFAVILWQQRGMDTVLQIALIFIGLATLLGLLDEGRSANTEAEADEVDETDAQTAQPSLEEEMMV
jgi:multisubunit Na+/H+ antiporter MnhB subunit